MSVGETWWKNSPFPLTISFLWMKAFPREQKDFYCEGATENTHTHTVSQNPWDAENPRNRYDFSPKQLNNKNRISTNVLNRSSGLIKLVIKDVCEQLALVWFSENTCISSGLDEFSKSHEKLSPTRTDFEIKAVVSFQYLSEFSENKKK